VSKNDSRKYENEQEKQAYSRVHQDTKSFNFMTTEIMAV
jgi:hypothetical protein